MINPMFGLPEISVSAAGFAMPLGSPARASIDAIASLGLRGIALDATMTSMRPRELSRSARRDIASILRRCELELSGIDLWIPPEHFVEPSTSERAIDATTQALEMAGELAPLVGGRSQPVVSVALPEGLTDAARSTLASVATHHGGRLADHALMQDGRAPIAGIGAGIDPVYYLTDGQSPAKAVARAGTELVSARLCDTNAMGRCPIGTSGSKLDLTGYAGAMIVSGLDWVTLDVRGLDDPMLASRVGIDAWRDAGTL
jgi:sugar phosphate isomerase/epimerase